MPSVRPTRLRAQPDPPRRWRDRPAHLARAVSARPHRPELPPGPFTGPPRRRRRLRRATSPSPASSPAPTRAPNRLTTPVRAGADPHTRPAGGLTYAKPSPSGFRTFVVLPGSLVVGDTLPRPRGGANLRSCRMVPRPTARRSRADRRPGSPAGRPCPAGGSSASEHRRRSTARPRPYEQVRAQLSIPAGSGRRPRDTGPADPSARQRPSACSAR